MQDIDYVVEASHALYDTITEELSLQSTKKYNNDSMTLAQLDDWRRNKLPEILKDRYQRQNSCWLQKDELVLLMDWKLAKGKYRPTLPSLIKSNSDDSVVEITKEGFHILLSYVEKVEVDQFWKNLEADSKKEYLEIVKKACDQFCKLRGVGPATASLICSLTTNINEVLAPPFFSDESFMFYILEPLRPETKIKYNIKEYIEELVSLYADILKTRTHVKSMNVLENGGWSLKMHDIYKFDKLSNVKLPSKLEKAPGKFPSLEITRLTIETSRKKRKLN